MDEKALSDTLNMIMKSHVLENIVEGDKLTRKIKEERPRLPNETHTDIYETWKKNREEERKIWGNRSTDAIRTNYFELLLDGCLKWSVSFV